MNRNHGFGYDALCIQAKCNSNNCCNLSFVAKVYLLFFLTFTTALIAQITSLRVGVPSPTAASLGKFGDIPVSLYTGTPDINIPLYEVRSRSLALPVTLKYRSSGVMVEELPGWVGLGWALEAGGVITRTMRGLPDDYSNGFLFTGHQIFNNWNNLPYGAPQVLLDIENGSIDSEPDVFYI